jgi:aminoglycoside phosphotransferase (APT) family kinase protein
MSHLNHAVEPLPSRPVPAEACGRQGPPPGAGDLSTFDVAARLLDYLSRRLGVPRLRYARALTPVNDGWETYIYHFQVQADAALPAAFQGPLTLRLFAGPEGVACGRHDLAVQRSLQQLDYPVPEPVLWEENCDVLRGPFLLMEQVFGPTLLHRLLARPWTVLAAGRLMADLQTRLHRLPVDRFPRPARPLLERVLEEIRNLMRQYRLQSLTPGLEWLRAHCPAPPEAPCIVHLDFHPLNLIYRQDQPPVVLDWDTADVGDAHADLATTVMLIRCASNEGKNLWERTLITTGRDLLVRRYLRACRKQMALDDGKLTYYRALAALRRLARCGRFLAVGTRPLGVKPSLVTRHLRRDHLQAMCDYVQSWTGVEIALEEGIWAAAPA